MVDFFKKNLILLLLLFAVLFSFQKTFISGLLPIPSDTIVGLYYPFRDIYAKTYPRGVPFKNFLITDPVRQTYPWRNLSISLEKRLELPLWNPYNFSGTPLLANFQSASFYPLNFLFFIFPFETAWSILIFLAPVLGALFMFLYLQNLKIKKEASLLGSIVFVFSGFSVAWLEWGNVVHTAIWMPLILLSLDKAFEFFGQNSKLLLTNKRLLTWLGILLLSIIFSFFAGHLQVFFYVLIFSIFYFFFRWIGHGRKIATFCLFGTLIPIFLVLTFIQWYPTLQFVLISARNADAIGYHAPGWFIPWQNLIQFIIPDFFGNPSTLNYSGIWNYAEFVGYVGIFPLIMALYAIFFRHTKITIFYVASFLIFLVLSLPTPVSKIPFAFHIPFIETSQPTRLIFLADFCLSVLAAMGFDYYSNKNKKMIYLVAPLAFVFIGLWVFVLFGSFGIMYKEDLLVARQNMFLPTGLFIVIFAAFVLLRYFYTVRNPNFLRFFTALFLLLTIFDLFRFSWKFEPFTSKDYLFPSTSVTSFLKGQQGVFRVMSNDSKILPPNFSIMYKIQTTDGYDPLYLLRYGEFVAAYSRGKPDISLPFGFNRIITLQNSNSSITDFLNIKYVISLTELKSDSLRLVFTDGSTKVYENPKSFDRAFFVSSTNAVSGKQKAIEALFDPKYLLSNRAIVEGASGDLRFAKSWSTGSAKIVTYSENRIVLSTTNGGDGYLVFTDAYYPTWHVLIDGRPSRIYLTDYAFRGVIVPKGEHKIEFYNSLL